jgi:ankyrin repeat protein
MTTPIKTIYLTSALLVILIVLYVNADIKYVPGFIYTNANGSADLQLISETQSTKTGTNLPDTSTLISEIVNSNGIDKGELPLHDRKIDIEKVKELILKGEDVNAKDQHSYTPLMIVSLRGAREIAEILIAHGADISARTNLGKTALICAAERGHLEIAALLISKEADINASDQNKRTPLRAATVHGNKQLVEFLIAKGADISGSRPQTLLRLAIFAGHIDLVKFYLSKGANAKSSDNDFETAPIMEAASFGRTDIAALLLAKGADVDAKSNNGYTALMSAAHSGHKETASLLIDNGANVNAVKSDNMMTPLLYAVIQGRKEIVELLISKGATVNVKDRSGKTPLIYAYELVRKEIQDILIANGAIDNRPKDEFVVVVKKNVPLRLLPQANTKTAGNASIGDYLKYLESTDDHKWHHVSKDNKNYWIYHEAIYREPKKLVATITADFQDVRGKGSLTPNPKMLFAVHAGVERIDYSAAMEGWDKELEQELEQKSVVSSYAINSNTLIKSINEKLILSKTIVKDMGCYSTNKYIGSDISLLNEKSHEVNATKFSQSFSLHRKDLFTTKLQGEVLDAKLLYMFKVKYTNGFEESVVRAINLTWPLCM